MVMLSGRGAQGRKRKDVTLIFNEDKKEESRTYRSVSCFESHKGNERTNLETVSRLTKDRKVTGSSQHGFVKGNSCLNNVINFCD